MTYAPAKQKGYTLIEMAIVLSVMGILIAAFASAYNLYHRTQKHMTTVANSEQIVQALGNYLVQNGNYPCPARMDVAREDPAYGMMGDCTSTTVAVGTCANGICVEQGERQVNINPNPGTAVNITPRVRRGAVPFRILGLPESASEDGNKNRFYYAVTENLTNNATYRKDSGGVSIVNGAGISMVTPAASAHFVVFSVGDDRRGAVTRYGRQVEACGNPDTQQDAMNCQTGSSSPYNLAVYRMSTQSSSATAAHYDDFVRYYASVETPLWRVSGVTGDNIVDLIDTGNVGIGVSSPAAKVHVSGTVKTSEAYMAQQVCNENGADCFIVDGIGGNDANPATAKLQCNNPAHPSYNPARPYVTGYQFGEAVCGSGTEEMRCPAGQILSGVSADGTLNCSAVTGCAPITVNMCEVNGVWQQAFIPSGVTNQVYQTDVFGVSYRRTYRCTNGAWALQSQTGTCSCTATTTVENLNCSAVFGGPANGWTGVATRPRTTTCPSGATTYGAIDSSACECVNVTEQRNRTCQQSPFNYPTGYACPSGQSPKDKRDWTCTARQAGSYTSYTVLAGSDCCTCTSGVRQTQWVSCGNGFNGTKEQERFSTCPGNTAWADTGNNSCTCNSSLFELTQESCPDVNGVAQVGIIEKRRNWNCGKSPQPGWDDWFIVNNNCGPVSYQWRPKTTGHGPYGVALSNTAGTSCPTQGQQAPCSYPATGGYTHYDSCRCE